MPVAADFRHRLEQICSVPTAPFHEGLVHVQLRAAVAAGPRLRERIDEHGNLEVIYGPGRPRLLFACHTDHPALRADGGLRATIVGGIRPRHLIGATLRPLVDDGRRFHVTSVAQAKPRAVVRLRRTKAASALRKGEPLLLDLPDLRITKRHVKARAIDDLCAVAACLTAADRLAAARFKGTVGFLFTRAEEVGFAGALGWVRTTRQPRSTMVVNLEMSNALRHTPQGKGPVLRVGDRITTFDPGVSVQLATTATRLAKRDKSFAWQRALMDGGACEATVYAQAGFRAGALCLPLKNYHNHARQGIGMEYVHTDDAENLVRWMVAFTKDCARPLTDDVGKRLERLWKKHRRQLARTAHEGEGRSQ